MVTGKTLKEIIKKAEENGFNFYTWYCKQRNLGYNTPEVKEAFYFVLSNKFMLTALIFSHDFAKAYWGENKHSFNGVDMCSVCGYYDEVIKIEYCYEHHLQQIALKKQRIKYLERFLK